MLILLQKPSTAVEYLAAHLSKIHGLDWHPDSEHILATSSQDNSVKVGGAPGAVGGVCLGGIRALFFGRKAAVGQRRCVAGAHVLLDLGTYTWFCGPARVME